MNNATDRRLTKAVEKLQEAQKQAKDALAEIDAAAGELLHRGAPALIEEQHADIVDATDHVKGVMARFEVINVEARTGIVDLGNVRKMSLKVSFGMGKLFADTIAAGEEERTRRQRRQTTIPGVDGPARPKKPKAEEQPQEQGAAPLRAPKDVPGIDRKALEALSDPGSFRDLGRALAQREFIIGDTVEPMMMAALAEMAGEGFILTLAAEEQAELRAGIAEGIAAEEAKARGEERALCNAQHPAGPAVCGGYQGHPGLHRGAGEHGNVEWNGPLTAQTAAGALPVFLARARELGRADATRKPGEQGAHARARFDSADDLWASTALAPPPELEPSKAVLFAAYEESYAAVPKKRGPGRPKKTPADGGAA